MVETSLKSQMAGNFKRFRISFDAEPFHSREYNIFRKKVVLLLLDGLSRLIPALPDCDGTGPVPANFSSVM